MYNIDITSDIHTSFIKNNYKDLFGINWVLNKSEKSDYLIIAWDINEDVFEIEKILNNIISETNYKKIIITFWNHDIWYKPGINRNDEILDYTNSIEKYNFLVNYFHWYKNKIHVVDKEDFIIEKKKLIITGNMWWYNYTINDTDHYYLKEKLKVNFDKMSYSTFSSSDYNNISFSNEIKSNSEFAHFLEEKLTQRLEKIRINPLLWEYKIITVSHVKPSNKLESNSPYFKELSKDQWENILIDWSEKYYSDIKNIFSNAFYLNNNLSKIYEMFNVSTWIYWHTHWNYKTNLDWVKYITNSFWYYLYEKNNPIITI